MIGILNLFLAASMPVLKVLLITAVGSFLALDRIKILTEDALKHLNTLHMLFYAVIIYTFPSPFLSFLLQVLFSKAGVIGNRVGSLGMEKILTSTYHLRMKIYWKA
ncbi:hypothetical protein DCAR_0520701 [Daucus carota subsp. sativus]|uniref:Uncharacterized protein n=1 Tax=Daucus carota subsp. sativus TaxID=79200 RepID=A0AAF0X6G0_DAUCS|nr:hypothetical protein DCAR_0520701 [Daucus carota subsp. sativus]